MVEVMVTVGILMGAFLVVFVTFNLIVRGVSYGKDDKSDEEEEEQEQLTAQQAFYKREKETKDEWHKKHGKRDD